LLINNNPSDTSFVNYLQNWNAYGTACYLTLQDPDQASTLEKKSEAFARRYWADQLERRGLKFQNIKDIYFNSAGVEFGVEEAQGEIRYLYLFGAVGFFLILIACINYVNLATAKSASRSREIGIRKVSGALRWQLISQFLIESVVISSIAFILSVGLVKTLLPYFNQITGKQFLFNLQTVGELLAVLLLISVVIGLLSGIYPAFYLSRMKPTKAVKGEVKIGTRDLFMRQSLVITQFTLSIIMIVATMVTSNQMNYIRDLNLGFDHEQIAVIDINNGNVRRSFETMKEEFEKVPGVVSAAASSRVPGEWKNIARIFIRSDEMAEDSLQTYFMCFDEDMIPTYNMEIVQGVNFSGNRLQDSTKVLINQELAEILDWQDPVGRYLSIGGAGDYQVIGVVKEFHFQSLHQDIAPLVIGPWSNVIYPVDYFSVKLSGQDLQQTLAGIKNVHELFDNTTAMDLHFLDQQLDKFYQADARAHTLFSIGAGLTVFIACLGLFGLASFIFQRRTKEISVRKVLGATVSNLMLHLSGSFVKQILLAFAIAVPVAWWLMYHWLGYFAYRVNIGVGVFVWALVLSLLVGLITIGHRALRTALVNPAETLKNE
jgi:putative ABC transport system permease protein